MKCVATAFTDVLVPVETTEMVGTEVFCMFAIGFYGLKTVQADGRWPWDRSTQVGRDALEAFQTTACWETNRKRNRYPVFECLISNYLLKEGEKQDCEEFSNSSSSAAFSEEED